MRRCFYLGRLRTNLLANILSLLLWYLLCPLFDLLSKEWYVSYLPNLKFVSIILLPTVGSREYNSSQVHTWRECTVVVQWLKDKPEDTSYNPWGKQHDRFKYSCEVTSDATNEQLLLKHLGWWNCTVKAKPRRPLRSNGFKTEKIAANCLFWLYLQSSKMRSAYDLQVKKSIDSHSHTSSQ